MREVLILLLTLMQVKILVNEQSLMFCVFKDKIQVLKCFLILVSILVFSINDLHILEGM